MRGKKEVLCSDKEINFPKRQHRANHISTKQRNIKAHEAKTDATQGELDKNPV